MNGILRIRRMYHRREPSGNSRVLVRTQKRPKEGRKRSLRTRPEASIVHSCWRDIFFKDFLSRAFRGRSKESIHLTAELLIPSHPRLRTQHPFRNEATTTAHNTLPFFSPYFLTHIESEEFCFTIPIATDTFDSSYFLVFDLLTRATHFLPVPDEC